MKSLTYFIWGATLLLAISVTPAIAQKRDTGEALANRIAEKLELTDQQRETLNTFRRNRKKIRENFKEMKSERKKLRDLLKDHSSSEKAVYDQVDIVNRMMSKMNTERVKNLVMLKKTLTPEQFDKLKKLAKKRIQKMRQRREMLEGQPSNQPGARPGQRFRQNFSERQQGFRPGRRPQGMRSAPRGPSAPAPAAEEQDVDVFDLF